MIAETNYEVTTIPNRAEQRNDILNVRKRENTQNRVTATGIRFAGRCIWGRRAVCCQKQTFSNKQLV